MAKENSIILYNKQYIDTLFIQMFLDPYTTPL